MKRQRTTIRELLGHIAAVLVLLLFILAALAA